MTITATTSSARPAEAFAPPSRAAIVLAAIAIVVTLGGCANATSPLSRPQTLLFSEQEMAYQGEQIYAQMKQEMPASTDRRKTAYVQCVTDYILAGMEPAERARYQWENTLFAEDSANAFALPGGKMGVLEGLLDVAVNQHQLATVVAHEVGHVTANHGNEGASRAALVNLGLAAAQAFGVSDGDVEALDLVAQLGFTLPFSRTQEREADILGVTLMANAGFDPRQSITLWHNMAAEGGPRQPEFLATHPSPDSRIRELQEMMGAAVALQQAANARGLNPDCVLRR